MSYRNILVHIDDSDACGDRVAAAIGLAKRHDAHLTGLGLAIEMSMPDFVHNQMAAEVLQIQRSAAEERVATATERFRAALSEHGLDADCRTVACLDTEAADKIALHARYSDLVVMGQADPGVSALGGRHMAEDVVLSSGRPVLVVPYIGTNGALGDKVVVAWDAGRESVRAVNDALPILAAAKDVTVLSVNPRIDDERHGEQPGADIALHLARHGCKVDVNHLESRDISIGDTILSYLADRGSDLLVMGGYGHSRWREVILGGVTRHISEHMTVPVFMSH